MYTNAAGASQRVWGAENSEVFWLLRLGFVVLVLGIVSCIDEQAIIKSC
jgi:hypothetical protein